jgi:hypothetical protein
MWPQKLVLFLADNGREPSILSVDSDERSLATWLARMRHNSRIGVKLPEEQEAYLESKGFKGVLRRNGRESVSNSMTEIVCRWVLAHGSLPLRKSEDAQERHVYAVLDRKRNRAKRYPSDIAIAASMGLPNILDKISKEEKSNLMALGYCSWVTGNDGRRPSARSEDSYERSLAAWLHNRVSVSRGVIPGDLHESDLRIFRSRGLSGLLN